MSPPSNSACVHTDSTCIHTDSTCIHTDSTCIHTDSTCIHTDSTCIHTDSTRLQVDVVSVKSLGVTEDATELVLTVSESQQTGGTRKVRCQFPGTFY